MKIESIIGIQHISNNKKINTSLIPTSRIDEINEASLYFHLMKIDGTERLPSFNQGLPAAIVCNEKSALALDEVPIIRVKNERLALSHALSEYYGLDYERLNIIGITGTNGKTSTARILEKIFEFAEHKVGYIGTGCIRIGNKQLSDKFYSMTTPDPDFLYKSLSVMQEEGCTEIIMEVSSHSIYLNKISPIRFKYGVFTNLSAEHMDLHKTMEEYLCTKESLFKQCKKGVFNLDDPFSRKVYERCDIEKISTGIINKANYYITDYTTSPGEGSRFFLRGKNFICGVQLSLLGAVNVYNALMASAIAIDHGIKPCIVKTALKSLKTIKGRMELIKDEINVIIDYAHTPRALSNLLHFVLSDVILGQFLILVHQCVDLGYIGCIAHREHLPVNTSTADDHGPLCIFCQCRSLFGTAADCKSGIYASTAGQQYIFTPRQRLLSRKIFHSAPPGNHHCPFGVLTEEFPVCRQGNGLGAIFSDAPIIINRHDQFHGAPQIAIGISKSKGWN